MASFKKDNKGFTLVELLVAMGIFVIFLGVVMSSYTSVIKAQREANDYRVMYVEARHVFEIITQDLRNGMVDYSYYNCPGGMYFPDEIHLINKDGFSKYVISLESDAGVTPLLDANSENAKGRISYETFTDESNKQQEFLNSEVINVDDLRFYIYPLKDPYSDENVNSDEYQFQPMVTVSAVFSKERKNKDPYTVTLQTTVSSRIFNQIKTDEKCV